MKTSKIKKITALTLTMILLNLVPVFAAQNTAPTNTNTSTVQKSITKEYTFSTETKPFTYEPPKTIKENGYEYEYKDISYKENNASEPVKTTKTYTNLTSKTVPNTITHNDQTLYLNGTPEFTATTTPAKKSTQTITETKQYNNVTPGTESEVIPANITKDDTTLKKDSQNYTTTTGNFSEIGTLTSYDHDMNVSGTSIQLTDSTPQQGDWQNDLRNYFGLPSDTRITSASWRASIQHQRGTNKNTRSINYSGTRTLYNYTVKYSGNKTVIDTPEQTVYSTTAEYIAKDKITYSVTATVTYNMTEDSLKALENNKNNNQSASGTLSPEEEQQQQEEIAQKAKEEREKALAEKKEKQRNLIIGGIVGLLLISGAIIGLIFKNKKKQPDAKHAKSDDFDTLFAKAAAIRSNKNEAKKETEKERRTQQKKEEAQRAKEEKARKAAEEKEKRRLEKEKAYEEKKAINEKRKEKENSKKSPLMKKLDQIKADISSDDE